jgi:hypothetical protein
MKTRRVDGKPETAADKRFFDLREKGYKGPIDRDGRKGKGKDAKILRSMRKTGRANSRRTSR